MPHDSPERTVCSLGGNGVKVGRGVEVVVGVGVCSRVGVTVAVAVGAGPVTWPVLRKTRKIRPAPMARTINISPMANGRLKVISGKRAPLIGELDDSTGAFPVKVRPHTRQRVADSLMRVPQVGQTLVDEMGSGLILLLNSLSFILKKSGYYIIATW